jgi:hypothetical protein
MYIALNQFGLAWQGSAWGWNDTRRFVSPASATRALHEAGEDLDGVSIIEDPFMVETYAHSA